MGKYQRLGTMLEQALEQRGCDADWLAWRCGVGKDAVERWLKGAGRTGLSSLVLLASALVELDRRELLEAGGYTPRDRERFEKLWAHHFGRGEIQRWVGRAK